MLLKDGMVFADRHFHRCDVRVENGIFTEIAPKLEVKKKEQVLKLSGKFVIPGLIDVHTHGREGVDYTYASEEEILRSAKAYVAKGVTSILATTMTMGEDFSLEMMKRLGNAIETQLVQSQAVGQHKLGSRILGINMEGPFLGADRSGCHDVQHLRAPEIEYFNRLDEAAKGHVRIVDVDPNYPQAMEFIRTLSNRKIVSIAHTSATYETACRAVDAGADHVTHLFNAMNSIHHREPGIPGMVNDRDILAELITDGFHIHPSVIRMVFEMYPEKLCLISDSLSAAGAKDGEYELGGLIVTVKEGKACLSDGTIACSTIEVFTGMKNCIRFGVPAEAAVLAATYNPAKSVRMEEKIGSIKESLLADFLIVDKDWNLEEVYICGQKLEVN